MVHYPDARPRGGTRGSPTKTCPNNPNHRKVIPSIDQVQKICDICGNRFQLHESNLSQEVNACKISEQTIRNDLLMQLFIDCLPLTKWMYANVNVKAQQV